MRRAAWIVIVVSLGAAAPPLCADQPEPSTLARLTVPGTSISFVPFVAMRTAEDFIGVENRRQQFAVVVADLPTRSDSDVLTEFEQIMTIGKLRERGVELESTERIMLGDREGLLLTARQARGGVVFRKFMLFLPQPDQVSQILVVLPLARDREWGSQLATMIRSFRAGPASGQKLPPYVMTLPTGWLLANQTAVFELYAPGGRFPVPTGKPHVAVTIVFDQISAGQQARYVGFRNLNRNYYSDCEVLTSQYLTIDGLPANISYVSAIDEETQQPVTLQYCYIFSPRTIFFLESRRSPEMSDATFEKIVRSWRLR